MEPPSERLADLLRSERAMILVRWIAAVFGAYQVWVYDNRPYPAGYRSLGLGVAAGLVLGNSLVWIAHRRARALRSARGVALGGLAMDIAITSAFVWLYAFDPESALWAVLFILPLEGAILFQLPGALGTWAASGLVYVARELWGASRYPGAYPQGVQWSSVTFRLGLVLLVTLVAGLMARNLTQQRAELREALAHVRRVDRLRARLVSTLAHDVRNPLTAIRGAIKVLLANPGRLDAATTEELLAGADHQSGRLERLAGDLLDLARLERGRLELSLKEVELRDAVRTALSFADEEGRYEVRIDPGLTVSADPGRLEQIIVNLASNALLYGEPPFVAEAEAADGAVILALRDSGSGVSPQEVPELFEPFRAEKDRGSVGLGLAIVKALAEAQGGAVWYEPNRPRGACFKVRLPVAARGDGSDEGA